MVGRFCCFILIWYHLLLWLVRLPLLKHFVSWVLITVITSIIIMSRIAKWKLKRDSGDWRRGLKYEGSGSLSLQLDHKWHHCHHLVLISFHLLAPPLQAISGYWVTGGPPLIIFMGTQGQAVLCSDEGIFIWMLIMLCSQYSGTFSAYLRIASEAFSSTESLISEGFMCFILPPCQLGPHAWWAG